MFIEGLFVIGGERVRMGFIFRDLVRKFVSSDLLMVFGFCDLELERGLEVRS